MSELDIAKLAKLMTELAGAVARKHELEAAGIIIVRDKRMCLFMSGHDEMTKERKSEVLRSLGEYCVRMAKSIAEGSCEIHYCELEHLEGEINGAMKSHKSKDKGNPGKGLFFPN